MFDGMQLEDLEQVNDAFPSQLIVMLYDRAIKGMADAIDAIGRGDIEARYSAATCTAEIVSQLYLSLDMEQGGEIADSLAGLYNFVLTRIPRINFANDVDAARQVIALLTPVRDAWHELDERIRSAVLSAENEAEGLVPAMAVPDAMTTAHGA
jgi:flagellar secretion chaperone FliS